MEWLWQSLGRGRQTLSVVEQGKPLARMELNLYKKDTYTISGISFDGQVSEQQREAVMLGACEWFRQQQIHLLLGYRWVQNWFAEHPQELSLIAQGVKTKSRF